MQQASNNPMGTDGFEFVEYTAPDSDALQAVFKQLGFCAIAHHRSKNVVLYRQGDINFLVNREPASFSQSFATVHGPSVCAFGIRVKDAAKAYHQALALGAKPFHGPAGPMELNLPAIYGIGHSLIYLIDRYADRSIYDVDFVPYAGVDVRPKGFGLTHIDHLTHNVHQGRMDQWAEFYQTLFAFKQIRYFDIHGQQTGLKSRAMVSPCGKIRIPINEPSDQKSQIQEYLNAYNGEGIQHIALSCDDIYTTVRNIAATGMPFLSTPECYYAAVDQRVPGHQEDLQYLQDLNILIDGAPQKNMGLLLQIFTQTLIGPIFFEIIQRKGNEGFGEGNFQALFEAIEQDQVKRGVL